MYNNSKRKRKLYIHRSVAFEDNLEIQQLLDDCDEIMSRDRWSWNFLVYSALKEYVPRHKANPQVPLKKALGIEAPLVCFRCNKSFPVLQKVEFISGVIRSVCSGCLKVDRERGVVQKVLGTT